MKGQSACALSRLEKPRKGISCANLLRCLPLEFFHLSIIKEDRIIGSEWDWVENERFPVE